jgi:hypothetical protein
VGVTAWWSGAVRGEPGTLILCTGREKHLREGHVHQQLGPFQKEGRGQVTPAAG